MYIEFSHVNKYFGDYKASDDVSIQINQGKLVGLLGPSGSGKTTILRILAGLEKEDSGEVFINGQLVNGLPTSKRGIGFVFQSYALFPYLNVYDNIAYGLKIQKQSKKYIDERVHELIELVGLQGLEKRYISQLSGGQKQRVAFARALAPSPQVLLLDEPFAAIDAKVRKELRVWLKDTIRKIGITSIFVTHDQDEAVEVADEIIIVNEGRVEQAGTPFEIYRHPKTPFVAQFIGETIKIDDFHCFKGYEAAAYDNEGKELSGKAIVRSEFIKLYKENEWNGQKADRLDYGKVVDVTFKGNVEEVIVDINGVLLKGQRDLELEELLVGEVVGVEIHRMFAYDQNTVYEILNTYLKREGDQHDE